MMTRRIYIYFVLTLLLGIFIGGSAVMFFEWHAGIWPRRRSGPERFIQNLTRDLNLTPDQVEKIKVILDESNQKFRDFRRQLRPQFDELRKEGRGRIRQVLTPEQVTKFDEIMSRLDARRRRGRGNRPPPPPPPSPGD